MTYTEYQRALADMGFARASPDKGVWRKEVGEPPTLLTALVSRKDTTVLVQIGPGEPPFKYRFRRCYACAAAFIRTYLEEDHG